MYIFTNKPFANILFILAAWLHHPRDRNLDQSGPELPEIWQHGADRLPVHWSLWVDRRRCCHYDYRFPGLLWGYQREPVYADFGTYRQHRGRVTAIETHVHV